MAIGERIRFIRNLRGMTQKCLGIVVGFSERTADIRMAQYEAGTRTPKEDLIKKLADALVVVPCALDVPDIDTDLGVMHTLFALEDIYGFKIDKLNGEVCIRLDKDKGKDLYGRFWDWQQEAEKYRKGEITKEEYDAWRYTYPEYKIKRTKEHLRQLRAQRRLNK